MNSIFAKESIGKVSINFSDAQQQLNLKHDYL